MADYERLLLTKAIQDNKLEDLAARGIEPQHFLDPYHRDVYDWVLEFTAKYGQAPSMVALKREFPRFRPKLSSEPLAWHIEQFDEHLREVRAIELVRRYHERLEDAAALKEIEVYAFEMAQELVDVLPHPRAERLSEGKRHKAEYYRRKKQGIKHGIDIGIPSYDQITVGLQPHELLIWGGGPGAGKTTAMQFTSINVYLQNRFVLFISLEVEAEQVLRRFHVMLAKIRAHALKALELEPDEERKWHAILAKCEAERLEHDIVIRDDIKNCTVERVALEQLRYKPGVVVVDYLEEMSTSRDQNGWQGVQENARGLKQLARTTKTPYVTGTQLNREGDVSYQSSRKIADMMIVLQPDEEDELRHEMQLMLLKYRDGPSRKIARMRWDIEHGDIHELTGSDHFPPRKPLSYLANQNGKGERSANIAAARSAPREVPHRDTADRQPNRQPTRAQNRG